MSIASPSTLLLTSLPFPRPRRNKATAVFASGRSTSASDTRLSLRANANFYEMLSLSPGRASGDDVKRAFRSMALRYHPDVCDPSSKEESTRMFVMLHEAYRTLSNPVLREEYNYSLGLVGGRLRSGGVDVTVTRRRWEEQVTELKRRSGRREGRRRGGTWGSLMRSRNNNNNNVED